MKICKTCLIEKSEESFRISKGRKNSRSTCRECERKACLNYFKNNIEKEKLRWETYRLENPEKVRHSKHLTYLKYYSNNSDKIKARVSKYARSSLGKLKRMDRHRLRSQQDVNYRIVRSLRSRMKAAMEGRLKSDKTFSLLGCGKDIFLKHIESQFSGGMSWSNYGLKGWHIDHILPCYSFDLTNPDEQKKCFHYTNLRPLWARDNLTRPRHTTGRSQ